MTCQLGSCSITKNKQYYRMHPKELQQALVDCQNKESKQCIQLRQLGQHLQTLVQELQHSPQGFGQRILALQQTIATKEQEVRNDKNNVQLEHSLAQLKEELSDELAVVKWLESPVSPL